MLAHGDEIGRTQSGNNNAYCQDNEITWMDWELTEAQADLLDFTRRLVELRRDNPVFRRRRFFAGSADHGGESEVGDIAWFEPNGEHMDAESWANGYARSVAVFLNGDAIHEPDPRGQRIVDDSFLICFNAHYEAIDFTIPTADYGAGWQLVVDTTDPAALVTMHLPGAEVTVGPRSVVVLRAPRPRQ